MKNCKKLSPYSQQQHNNRLVPFGGPRCGKFRLYRGRIIFGVYGLGYMCACECAHACVCVCVCVCVCGVCVCVCE